MSYLAVTTRKFRKRCFFISYTLSGMTIAKLPKADESNGSTSFAARDKIKHQVLIQLFALNASLRTVSDTVLIQLKNIIEDFILKRDKIGVSVVPALLAKQTKTGGM